MRNRQEVKKRRRRQEALKRFLPVGLVILGAALVALVLIAPNLKLSSPESVTPIATGADRKLAHGTSMGDPNAPVKVDVWEDFQCSGCLHFSKSVEPQLLQAYVDTGKVYYTFHFFPFIDGGQGESHDAANAALCASAQGRFWDYHDILFANWIGENAGSFTRPRLLAFAQTLGLDMSSFKSCFEADKYAATIQQDLDAGSKRGVPPTPGIFVNDKLVVSSQGSNFVPTFEDMRRLIDIALGS